MRREVLDRYISVMIFGLLLTTVLYGFGLTSDFSHAETTSANASVTVAEACTMTATVDSAHSATVNPGQYVSEIGQTTLKVVCNDAEGYAIYAVGNANNEYGNNKLLANLGGTLSPTYDIATGTATSGNTSNWAMKVNAVTGAYAPTIQNSFGSYHEVPNAYMKVAQYNSNTDTSTGSSITSTYAAYVKSDQPAGSYNGKVKYTMVHPTTEAPLSPQTATSNCINYFPNGSNVVGTMGCQSIGTSDTSATLLASNFSRTGYGFAGWSDVYDYGTNPNAKFYGPQETIAFTTGQYTGTNPGLALYAVWIKSAGSLQDSSKVATLCGTGVGSLTTAPIDDTANLSSVSALTDQRDNETYAIAKLADGKCWMIENLRLESTNSDNSTGVLAQGYGTSATDGNFSGLADAESTGFTLTYTANSLYYSGTQEGTASIDIGTSNYPGYRMPRYNNTNTSARASSPTSNGGAMYSYGNYYTWHAAIADLTRNGTNNQSTTSTSLCPTGWHLPTGGKAYASGDTSGVNVTGDTSTFREFYNLGYKTMDEVKTAYEDTPNSGTAYYSSNTTNTAGKTATAAIRSFPNNFLYSGGFGTSSASHRGICGNYWSSTAGDSYRSYLLTLSSSIVSPGTDSNYKYSGYSIRCMVSAGT